MIEEKIPKETMEYFKLSEAVSDLSVKEVKVGEAKWTKREDLNLKTATQNSDTSFQSAIYTNQKGDMVVAFSGSKNAKDWVTDFRQGVGLKDKQYQQAADLAKEVVVKYPNIDIKMTGHSLGGGLATYASAVTGKPAITINPAAVHRRTLKREGIDPKQFRKAAENGLVTRYIVKGEVLDRLQSLPFVTSSQGRKVDLEAVEKLGMIKKHSLSNAIDALEVKVEKYTKAMDNSSKEDAIEKYPELKPVYDREDKAKDLANNLDTPINETDRSRLIGSVRRQSIDAISRGQELPEIKPIPTNEPKVKSNEIER